MTLLCSPASRFGNTLRFHSCTTFSSYGFPDPWAVRFPPRSSFGFFRSVSKLNFLKSKPYIAHLSQIDLPNCSIVGSSVRELVCEDNTTKNLVRVASLDIFIYKIYYFPVCSSLSLYLSFSNTFHLILLSVFKNSHSPLPKFDLKVYLRDDYFVQAIWKQVWVPLSAGLQLTG